MSSPLFAFSDPESPLPYKAAIGSGYVYRFNSVSTNSPFFLFACSYANPYSVDNLNSFDTSFSYWNKIFFGIDFSFFGTDWYSESDFSISSGYFSDSFFRPEISFDLHVTKYNFHDKDEYAFNFDTDPHITVCILNYFEISALQKKLLQSLNSNNYDILNNFSAGIRINFSQGLSLDYNHTYIDSEPLNSIGVNTAIFENFLLKTGYINETDSFYISTSLFYNKYKFSYCYKYHAYLETTHMVGFSFTTSSFSSTPFNFGKSPSGKNVLKENYINLQTCSAEDLFKITGFPQELTERIIKYREMFGTITISGLKKIGCTEKQIGELEAISINTIPEKTQTGSGKKKKRIEKKKKSKTLNSTLKSELLKRLTNSGIPPKTAYMIADKSSSLGLKSILQWIDTLITLTTSQKLKAKTICAEVYSL